MRKSVLSETYEVKAGGSDALGAQYRAIGISAVAAALRYQSAVNTNRAAGQRGQRTSAQAAA